MNKDGKKAIKRSSRYVVACDFETTTENQYEIDGCTRVWWYGYQPLSNQSNWNDVIRGTELEEFINHMKQLATDYDNPLAYFHNLKFDGSFILYWLLENGYQEDRELSEEKTFSTIITGEGRTKSFVNLSFVHYFTIESVGRTKSFVNLSFVHYLTMIAVSFVIFQIFM